MSTDLPHQPWRSKLHADHRDNDLVRGSLNSVEVFGQSIAAAGPSIAIAGTLPIAYVTAGSGSIASILLGTLIVLLVAVVVAQFAREHATTGSLYSYASEGLGPWGGFTGGWGLALGYTGIASACAAGVALFGGGFLDEVGAGGSSRPVLLLILAAAVVLALLVTIRGVKLSTQLAIVLEVVSLIAIFAVFAAALIHFGFSIDTAAARETAAPTLGNIAVGAVAAVTVFVGFESAGSLGAEAANPYRAIPRAIYFTAIVAGGLYLIAGVVQLIAFSSGADTANAITPFNAIATASQAGWLSPIVDLGVAISAFACTVASLTGAARSLFSLSREGALPPAFGRAHAQYQTPHIALSTVAAVALVVPVLYVLLGSQDTVTQLWASYVATAIGGTYGYLLAYLLVAASALIHFGRARTLKPYVAVAAVLSILGIGFVGYNVFDQYDRSLPYGFTALLAAGLAWFAVVWTTRRSQAEQVGTFSLARESAETAGQGVPGTAPDASADAPAVRQP
jgi:amino acid transporter